MTIELSMVKGIINVDKQMCTGCRRCEIICSTFNDGKIAPSLARIQVIGTQLYKGVDFTPELCVQCVDPPCLKACPQEAIKADIEHKTNARIIDEDKCDGCKEFATKKCIEACDKHFNPPRIRFDPGRNVAIMCNLCNGNPQCVIHCLFGALTYYENEKGIMTGVGGGI